MKHKVYILIIYLFALTVLPSVRAIKLQFAANSEKTCSNSQKKECETGKFVMGLNFSPLQVVNQFYNFPKTTFQEFDLKKQTSFYKSFFIPIYQNTVWHPPKYFVIQTV